MVKKQFCKPATKKEIAYCMRLEKLLLKMPKGLFLYSGGSMQVLKAPPSGNTSSGEGHIIENVIYNMDIKIHSEGGDW